MVELDHSFSTGKPTDYNWEAILDLDRLIPCVQGGKVIERTSPTAAKAEIKVKMGAMSMTFAGTVEVVEQDDAAHRALLQGQVARDRRPGPRERRRRVRPRRRRRHDPHRGADHRQGRVDGRGRRGHRARRADQGLHPAARGDLSAGGDDVPDHDAADPPGRGAQGRRHGAPGGARPARLERQRPERLRLRRVRQRARRRDGPRLHDQEGPREVRGLPDGQRRDHRRVARRRPAPARRKKSFGRI